MSRLAAATADAKRAIRNPEIKAMYQSAVKGAQRVFNIAVKDLLQAQTIESIEAKNYLGRVGDSIFVRTTEDFKVTGVEVFIYIPDGDLVERGNAVMQEDEMEWLNINNCENPVFAGIKIVAMASDLPGNCTSFSIIV